MFRRTFMVAAVSLAALGAGAHATAAMAWPTAPAGSRIQNEPLPDTLGGLSLTDVEREDSGSTFTYTAPGARAEIVIARFARATENGVDPTDVAELLRRLHESTMRNAHQQNISIQVESDTHSYRLGDALPWEWLGNIYTVREPSSPAKRRYLFVTSHRDRLVVATVDLELNRNLDPRPFLNGLSFFLAASNTAR